MVSQCMKTSSPFGVILAEPSPDTGLVSMRSIGTLATIVDWFQGSDGLLGITASGAERFRLLNIEQQDDGLNIGTVELLTPETAVPLDDEFVSMAALLRAVIDDLGRLYENFDKHYDDTTWVGFRFAEILPLELVQKQYFLELDDPVERLRALRPSLQQLREEQMQ
jgi:Lon protease-like protein